MKEFKMRFNDFVFDTNPSYIQVITARDVSKASVYNGKTITQDISQKPIIVKGKGMFLIGFVTGAMVGGTLAIAFHCLIIIGKESDRKWEEEQTTKNEKKQED